MRLDVVVKCIRIWIIIFFMDGVVAWVVGVGWFVIFWSG